MQYADVAGIEYRSSNSLAKITADIVAVCRSFGLIVSEAKTEAMCGWWQNVCTESFSLLRNDGQVYKQTTKFVDLGATVYENAGLKAEINRLARLANLP